MDEFIDHVYGESMGIPGRKIEPIDAISILYEIHIASPEHLGKNSFLTPDTFFPVGMKLYNDLEELYIEGVPPKKVKEIDTLAGEKIPGSHSKKTPISLVFLRNVLQKNRGREFFDEVFEIPGRFSQNRPSESGSF